MTRLASVVAGRRSKWVVILAWIVAVVALSPLGAKLADATTDDTESFLPTGAESTEVQALLEERFDSGETGNGLIVYQRDGGLTDADRRTIADDARQLADELPLTAPPAVPFAEGSPPELVAMGEATAYTALTVPLDFERSADWGETARDITAGGDGLDVYVTGDIGLQADFEEVFGDLDIRLLLATVILVLALLGAIYRSPLIAVTPIFVVGMSYFLATAFIYLYAESGQNVNTNSTTILVVLMFGVGTDYCLLLVSRFREELRREQDKHLAMQHALRRAGPALLASGCTVIAAMLVLLLSQAGSTKTLGPVSAIGVAAVLLAGLTLLPALLTVFGRVGFWPRRGAVVFAPDAAAEHGRGIWRRVGDRVLRRPGLTLGVTAGFFAICSLGLLAYQEDYSIGGFFKKDTESVTGFEVLGAAFPAGALGPTLVLVQREGGQVNDQDLAAARRRLRDVDGVETITPSPERSEDGSIGQLSVVFRDDPYSEDALARVDVLRDRLDGLGPEVRALVGAGSAVQTDFNRAAERDLRVVVPVALLVITLILGILLRAIVAPLVLILTVLASFIGTLGLSVVFFTQVLGDRGVDASLPTFAFIFLVALGVDYTIFLMSRVREEASLHGTREGVLRALSATGPVITSAGLILAGTFSVLMTLPVTFAFNIGFMVAVGILLDTFIVRTLMVPAAVELLGERVWWPSTERGRDGALHEQADAETADERTRVLVGS